MSRESMSLAPERSHDRIHRDKQCRVFRAPPPCRVSGARQIQQLAAPVGGNIQVGLEDNLYLAKEEFAQSNAVQVPKIGHILNELSLEVATPTEVRQMLALKGKDNVAFYTSRGGN